MASPSSSADVATAIFEALQRRDLDAVRRLQHDETVSYFVELGVSRDGQGVRAFFEELFAAIPDGSPTPERILADGDYAVVQWRVAGTFSGGPFHGIHATGGRVELRGVDVMHIVDGRLLDNTIYTDGLSFVRQIGLLSPAGSRTDRVLTAAFNAKTDLRSKLAASSRNR